MTQDPYERHDNHETITWRRPFSHQQGHAHKCMSCSQEYNCTFAAYCEEQYCVSRFMLIRWKEGSLGHVYHCGSVRKRFPTVPQISQFLEKKKEGTGHSWNDGCANLVPLSPK